MTEEQCIALMKRYHIYPDNGHARMRFIAMIQEAYSLGRTRDVMVAVYKNELKESKNEQS